jgi:hypothetical protein
LAALAGRLRRHKRVIELSVQLISVIAPLLLSAAYVYAGVRLQSMGGTPPIIWIAASAMATIGLLGIWSFSKALTRARRARRDLCLACGYDLRASRDRCPECGTVRAQTTSPPA